MTNFEKLYNEVIKKSLVDKFGYTNSHEIPKLTKIVLNMGVGDAVTDKKKLTNAAEEMGMIAGQKPERDTELHYRNVLFIVFKLVGLYTQVEYHTSQGRIDLVLKTDRYIYVMEFKLNGSADEALAQIREKGYAAPFAKDSRTVYKIGVNFSDELRNIQEVKVEVES